MSEEDPDPFEQLAGDGADEPVDIDDLFAESAVDDIDSDSLWSEVEAGVGSAIAWQSDEPDISIVPKQSFCQNCPHLADPPDVTCTHEGTEILDFPDSDHVRVRDCPIVEERSGVMTADEAEFRD